MKKSREGQNKYKNIFIFHLLDTQHNKNINASQADLRLTQLQWKSKQYFHHHRKMVTRTYMGSQKKKKKEKGRTVRQVQRK